MKILIAPHPMLETECRSDAVVSLDQIHEMFQLMRAHNGAGLAAPQVGIDARVFVTMWNQVFVNPEIVEQSDSLLFGREGCLSLPGEVWMLGRPRWVKLASGEVFTDFKARVICHELDHLNGILINA